MAREGAGQRAKQGAQDDALQLPSREFTLETPVGWKEITLQDSSSFDGVIVMGQSDTLHFSFGPWRSRFHYGQVSHTEDPEWDTPVKIYSAKIDGCRAYRDVQQGGEGYIVMDWPRCFYIDTVYMIDRDAIRFDFWGKHLSEFHEELFHQVVQTIRFER